MTASAARLMTGPLAQSGGVITVDGLPDRWTTEAMLREAFDSYPQSTLQEVPVGDGATGRGGTPERRLRTCGGGPVQDRLYAERWLADYLGGLCGTAVEPTGGRGSYSYYVEPGDYLGLHLDIDTCDVTLITVLRDLSSARSHSGALLVHSAFFGSSLAAVRADPARGVSIAQAGTGQSIVLLGGLLPHETVPLGEDGERIISALCFRAV